MPKPTLTIGWFYPDLMNTYGDLGNVTVLKQRAIWAGIDVKIRRVDLGAVTKEDKTIDLMIMGGAQDRQQAIVSEDLLKHKRKLIETLIQGGTPALFVCGAYQFMGSHYITAEGSVLDGLNIFDLYTEHPGTDTERLVGNVVLKSELFPDTTIVGFENHGGRTYLGKGMKSFADVVNGHGNNGTDRLEGVLYKHAIGTYLHGPLLPKNPFIADWLVTKAIEHKYQQPARLNFPSVEFETTLRDRLIQQIQTEKTG